MQDTTNMRPKETEKEESEFDVKANLESNARHRRKNPVLEIGDMVRSFRKKGWGKGAGWRFCSGCKKGHCNNKVTRANFLQARRRRKTLRQS